MALRPRPQWSPHGSRVVYEAELADWRVEAMQDAANRMEIAVERLILALPCSECGQVPPAHLGTCSRSIMQTGGSMVTPKGTLVVVQPYGFPVYPASMVDDEPLNPERRLYGDEVPGPGGD